MAVDMEVLNAQLAAVIEGHVGRRIFNEVLVEVIEAEEQAADLAEATARRVCGTTWGHEMRPHDYAAEIGRDLVHALSHGALESEHVSRRVLTAFLDCIDVRSLGMYCMHRTGLQDAWQPWPLPTPAEEQ